MIESIIRLSTVRNETGALEGEEKGRRGDWDEGIDEDEDRPQPPPNVCVMWPWSSLSSPYKSGAGCDAFLVIVGWNGPNVNRCVTAHGS